VKVEEIMTSYCFLPISPINLSTDSTLISVVNEFCIKARLDCFGKKQT